MRTFLIFMLLFATLQPGCGAPEQATSPRAASDQGRQSVRVEQAGRSEQGPAPPTDARPSLPDARRGFRTRLDGPHVVGRPAPEPPPRIFRLSHYDAPAGKLAAYLTPDPGDGKRHPAIVWITGGDSNTIDELWEPAPRENDQSAAAYRLAGIVMMFPSLRGGNDNPGRREGFLGEVDDVLAAAAFVAAQPYVDPARIYLGGHSTGGTIAMLVAESTDRFRAVFAFGPADDVGGYPKEYLPFDETNPRELEIRSPGRWLDSARCPLFVLEGTDRGNIDSLKSMARASRNPLIHFLPVEGASHFNILAPLNERIAGKILKDAGPKTTITFTREDLGGFDGR